MKIKEFQHKPVQPDTYEASMALNQLMRIAKCGMKLHNMIDNDAEMESWVAKKIDLAGDYVKKVYNYTEADKAGLYDDGGMSEMKKMPKGTGTMQGVKEDAGEKIANMAQNMTKDEFMSNADELGLTPKEAAEYYEKMQGGAYAHKFEDAGEGHMSKSQLYQTAKMSIELIEMIKKGDDLEGWVQTKLNLAADYLQAVYHYEDYQKLNPYREEIDGALMQKHAGVIQKHLDEILSKETRIEDVDTKPGMMRILKKRVNEVEKEIAKENRKQTDEAELEEGLKDWAKNLAMAGVIVAGLAGVNSINDAIDSSIPAVQAMETALEMAQDQGNTELADMIKKDLSAVKVRLSSGKDLNYVKGMQEKYSKFVKTEGLAYESKLQVHLNQQLK